MITATNNSNNINDNVLIIFLYKRTLRKKMEINEKGKDTQYENN